MDNLVLFRLTDDDSIYVADIAAGTVERRDANSDGDAVAELIAQSGEKRGEGPFVRGIDFALAARSRAPAASHTFYR